jgi:GxxExxY protein
MSENEIATTVLEICFRVHKKYGPGLFESVYETIFCHELAKTGLSFQNQQPIPLVHDTIKLNAGFRADVIIENKVIIEIKSIDAIADVHSKQVLTYLKLTLLKLGLLVNFNVPLLKDGIKRVVNHL